jgi:hypothetical protein
MKEASLKSSQQARDLVKNGAPLPLPLLEDLTQVLLDLGRPEEALALFSGELCKEEHRKEEARLQWKLAHYHESLGQRDISHKVYQQLAQAEDPFWARLAKDRIEGIRFERDVESFRRP